MSNREGDVPRIFRMGSGGGGIVAASTGTNDRKPDWAPAPKVCLVPKVKGKSGAAAGAAMKLMGCKLGKAKAKASEKPAGTILKQGAKPGTKLTLNARVKVVVAS